MPAYGSLRYMIANIELRPHSYFNSFSSFVFYFYICHYYFRVLKSLSCFTSTVHSFVCFLHCIFRFLPFPLYSLIRYLRVYLNYFPSLFPFPFPPFFLLQSSLRKFPNLPASRFTSLFIQRLPHALYLVYFVPILNSGFQ